MTFRPVYANGRPQEWVNALAGKSGVYVIREAFAGEVLYVGESHSGRLKKTLLHHFQHWEGPTSGPTFNPDTHEAAVITTPAEFAVESQDALIERYQPERNRAGNWLNERI